jgi:hypothetical protein
MYTAAHPHWVKPSIAENAVVAEMVGKLKQPILQVFQSINQSVIDSFNAVQLN